MYERRQDIRQETLDMVYTFVRRGLKERATDVHWEPFSEAQKEGLVVRFRVDGLLKDVERLTGEKTNLGSIMNAIKLMAEMDPTQRREQQDGRMTFRQEGVEYDIRVASMPTILGEKIVMRLMDRNRFCLKLSDLGMTQEVMDQVGAVVHRPEGFIVISGPTGAGKTTTLYSILQQIYSRDKNLCTIEDPVEVKFPGINQVQVEPNFGMTFVKGLRAIMRQDPNVIAVGEMRDPETVRTALEAALTGTLVFSTIHARDSVNTIVRMLDMGVEPFFIASALTGVISQRLIRLVCIVCKGKGCVQCANIGYRKRMGIFEVLKINDGLRTLILKGGSAEELRRAAAEGQMVPFHRSCVPLVEQGLTTQQEIDRVLALD
ncbi:MAG: GspE/PulE family protein [Deltaproteobacteria bacterium]